MTHLTRISAAHLFLALSILAAPTRATLAVDFEDLAGWWHAPVEHAGQRSEVFLHLLVVDDTPTARLSLVAMDAWEVPVGAVSIDGNRLDMAPYSFPLDFDPEQQTLSGVLLEAAVPVGNPTARPARKIQEEH